MSSYKDYLQDSAQYGDYQYVTIEQVVNDFIANTEPDDYTANVPRHKILFNAMRGLRELYYDVMQEVKGVELQLTGTLNVVLPPDYVNYVRISWVDEEGQLHPMTENRNSNIARDYLQDHLGNLLFDASGCVLRGSGTRPSLPNTEANAPEEIKSYGFVPSYTPNINLSKYHKNGSYRIDKENGLIQFDSNAASKNIVLEYISDGLFTSTCNSDENRIRVHKFAEQALIDWIYWNLIKRRRNVPQYAIRDARKDYFNARRIAKRRINTIRKEQLIQAMSGSTMNIEPSN